MNRLFTLVLILFFSCSNDNSLNPEIVLREEVMVENSVFRISYNETKEQPNWIEYDVRDFVKVADRGNMDFYTVSDVWTSDDNDYYKNEWDKGHMAPAGSFTDSWSNLARTFSFVNCALQKDSLNRGEWRELEEQVREWARDQGTVSVRIELKFSTDSQVLNSGATVPDGFFKYLTFSDNRKMCFYFDNLSTDKDWTEHEIVCN